MYGMRRNWLAALGIAAGLALSAPVADAASFVFSATDLSGRSAQATFDQTGTTLTVTFSNLAVGDVTTPPFVLTALFFTLTGDPALTRVSADLGVGSSVINCSAGTSCTQPGAGPNAIGSEWAYKNGLSGAPGSADEGISAVGFGLFGPGDRFATGNLSGNANGSLQGIDFGLTTLTDDPNSPANGDVHNNALIANSAVFVFTLPAGYVLGVEGVNFQYGSALEDTNLPCVVCGTTGTGSQTTGTGTQVPEPASIVLLGMGLLALGGGTALGRRRK